MKSCNAIKEMLSGKQIRRKIWNNRLAIGILDGNKIVQIFNGEPTYNIDLTNTFKLYSFQSTDILAQDWQILQ